MSEDEHLYYTECRILERIVERDLVGSKIEYLFLNVNSDGRVSVNDFTLRTEDGRELTIVSLGDGDPDLYIYVGEKEDRGWREVNVHRDYKEDVDSVIRPWKPGSDRYDDPRV